MVFVKNITTYINSNGISGFPGLKRLPKHNHTPFSNSTINSDKFFSNPIDSWLDNLSLILHDAKNNSGIKELSKRYGFSVNSINNKTLKELKFGHLQDTRIKVSEIYSKLPQEIKRDADLKNLQDAAKYHDVGKLLIPDKILNKPGKLSEKEWEIMQLHSDLSYELLKNKGLDNKALELIKNHHLLSGRNGANVSKNIKNDINLQILTAADIYSALTENRAYKKALSKNEALEIISKHVNGGIISEEVFKALSKI